MLKMAELDQPVQEGSREDYAYEKKRQHKLDNPDYEPYHDEPKQAEKDADAEARAERKSKLDAVLSGMGKKPKVEEEVVDECGMMGGPMGAPAQQDSVTMNVSMNGSGKGGIRDLLNVLRDMQGGGDTDSEGGETDIGMDMDDMDSDEGPGSDDDMLMLKKLSGMGDMIDDDFGNSAPGDEGPEMMPMPDAGNDLHREKDAFPKASGGDNAMRLAGKEHTFKIPSGSGDLKIRLENLYNEIKSR